MSHVPYKHDKRLPGGVMHLCHTSMRCTYQYMTHTSLDICQLLLPGTRTLPCTYKSQCKSAHTTFPARRTHTQERSRPQLKHASISAMSPMYVHVKCMHGWNSPFYWWLFVQLTTPCFTKRKVIIQESDRDRFVLI